MTHTGESEGVTQGVDKVHIQLPASLVCPHVTVYTHTHTHTHKRWKMSTNESVARRQTWRTTTCTYCSLTACTHFLFSCMCKSHATDHHPLFADMLIRELLAYVIQCHYCFAAGFICTHKLLEIILHCVHSSHCRCI